MSGKYYIKCPNCNQQFSATSWQTPGNCPSCGANVDQPEDASYRPALGSRTARIVAAVILAAFMAMLLAALIAAVLD